MGRNFALCSHWIDFCIYTLKSGEYHDGFCLKVSKSQRHFFLKLHSPINEGNIRQSLRYEARAEFCLIFCSFFGQWRLKKNYFWALLTFIRMFLFTIYCKKHLHLLRYFKNSQNTCDFINYFIPLRFTWPVWYDTILPSGSSELYSFFISFYNKRFWFSLFWNETFAPKYKASVKVWNQTNLLCAVLTS